MTGYNKINGDYAGGKRVLIEDVLYAPDEARWELVTFDDPDFDPGFKSELPVDQRQVFQISVFSDNAETVTTSLLF
jgi:hypothetical protein